MSRFSFGRRARAGVTALLAGGAGLIATAPAHASLLGPGSCPAAPVSQPFAQWGDGSSYELAPGGAFDGSTTSWTLSGNASVVSGGDPYNPGGAASPSSVSLPAGASAQSPFMCMTAADPTLRFFATNGGGIATTLVQVVIRTPLLAVTLPVGVVAPDGSWNPSPVIGTGAAVAGLLSGGSAQMALRFTALTGTTQIDDVFVDPRMRD